MKEIDNNNPLKNEKIADPYLEFLSKQKTEKTKPKIEKITDAIKNYKIYLETHGYNLDKSFLEFSDDFIILHEDKEHTKPLILIAIFLEHEWRKANETIVKNELGPLMISKKIPFGLVQTIENQYYVLKQIGKMVFQIAEIPEFKKFERNEKITLRESITRELSWSILDVLRGTRAYGKNSFENNYLLLGIFALKYYDEKESLKIIQNAQLDPKIFREEQKKLFKKLEIKSEPVEISDKEIEQICYILNNFKIINSNFTDIFKSLWNRYDNEFENLKLLLTAIPIENSRLLIPYAGYGHELILLEEILMKNHNANKIKKILSKNILLVETSHEQTSFLKLLCYLKNISPEIKTGDISDPALISKLGKFDVIFSNQPFEQPILGSHNTNNYFDHLIENYFSILKQNGKIFMSVDKSYLQKNTVINKNIQEISIKAIIEVSLPFPPFLKNSCNVLILDKTDELYTFVGLEKNENDYSDPYLEKLEFGKIVSEYIEFEKYKKFLSDENCFFVNKHNLKQKNWKYIQFTSKYIETISKIKYQKKLKDVVEIIVGKKSKTNLKQIQIKISDIDDIEKKFINELHYVNPKQAKEVNTIQKDDILFSRQGVIGKAVIVSENIEGLQTSPQIFILRIKKPKLIESRFLFSALKSENVRFQIENESSGFIPYLSKKSFEEIIINVPPLDEQKNTAEKIQKIKEKMAEYEHLIDELKQQLRHIVE